MVKTLDSGLKLMPSNDGIYSFLFDNNKLEQSLDYIKGSNIKRVMINPFHGFTSDNLTSLAPISSIIEELIIGTEKIRYDGLDEFHNLTLLGVPDNQKDIVDLKNFPRLTTLNCSVTERLKGLANASGLKKLTISDFRSKTMDLSVLPPLVNLEQLSLIKTNVITLTGVERYSNLKKFEIFNDSKLESLAALRAISKSLEQIQLVQCKKIGDFEILGELKFLKKIILTDSGTIRSLAFLEKLSLIESISFWGTNVLDGNIGHCEGIAHVGFDDKRHYSRKAEQFKK